MSKNRLSTDCAQELNFNFFSEEPARTNFTEDEKKQVQKVLDALKSNVIIPQAKKFS